MNPNIYQRTEHTVSRKNIDTDALKIIHRLLRNGFKAYLVGGGVRDLLLDKKPKDFDIATDATPRQIKSLFRNCRIIGKRFKLAHIFFKDNKIIEVSTFRDKLEDETGKVSTLAKDNLYGTEMTDAIRRDLTINALYYDLNTFSIIDYVGGFKDLQKKIIRIIGNPSTKIIEDPVRMWRAIRHCAKCDFKLETESKKAILENKDLIKEIPIMRMHDELKKDFCSGFSYSIFNLAEKLNILELILPELSSPLTALGNKDNETSLALMFIDHWINEGQNIPLASVLAVLAISIKKSLEKDKYYQELFLEEQDIDDFTNTLFTKFFVPKKEKELVVLALKLWRKFVTKKQEVINIKALSRRVALTELKYLIWFTINDETLIKKIDEALELKAELQEERAKKYLKEKTSFRTRKNSGNFDNEETDDVFENKTNQKLENTKKEPSQKQRTTNKIPQNFGLKIGTPKTE